VPGANTYRITPHGRTIATFLTKLAAASSFPPSPISRPLLAPSPAPRPLTVAWRSYERELDDLIAKRMAASKLASNVRKASP